jgi:multiple sugar transport system substrate-binding protein
LAGVTMPTSRQYDTLLMMFQNVLWAFGGTYGDTTSGPKIDSPETQEAIAFFKQLLETSSTGGRNQDYGAVASSYIAGNAAMCANFLGFFPQIDDPEQNKNYANKTGYFNMPAGPKGRFASLGGQGLSINAHIAPDRQARAKEFLKWFAKPETQREWVKGKGCFTTNTAILKSDAFKNAAPYNPLFDEAFAMVNDFWSIAEFDPMLTVAQQQFSAIFQDNKDPKAAVKEIQTKWEQVLKDAGYMKQVAAAR